MSLESFASGLSTASTFATPFGSSSEKRMRGALSGISEAIGGSATSPSSSSVVLISLMAVALLLTYPNARSTFSPILC